MLYLFCQKLTNINKKLSPENSKQVCASSNCFNIFKFLSLRACIITKFSRQLIDHIPNSSVENSSYGITFSPLMEICKSSISDRLILPEPQ
jgi:hypothetical protein